MNIQRYFGLLFLSLTVLYTPLVQAKTITRTYDITANKTSIGTLTTTHTQKADSVYSIQTSTNIEQKNFWGDWSFQSTSTSEFDPQGIVLFDHKIRENSDNWHVYGQRQGKTLWCAARKVQTIKEKNDQETVDMAKTVVSHAVPYAGMAMTLLADNQNENDIRIETGSFQTSLTNLPSFLANSKQQLKNTAINVFDSTELAILKYNFSRHGKEQIVISGKRFDCAVFKAKTPNGRLTCWIAQDESGAFLVKETGTDSSEPYEVILSKTLFTP